MTNSQPGRWRNEVDETRVSQAPDPKHACYALWTHILLLLRFQKRRSFETKNKLLTIG